MEENNNQTTTQPEIQQPVVAEPVQAPVVESVPVSVAQAPVGAVPTSPIVPTEAQAVPSPVQNDQHKSGGGKKGIVLGILGVVLVIAIIGVGVYFYMTTMSTKTAQVTPPPPVLTEVTKVPVKEPEVTKVVVVKSTSDLDALSAELDKADNSLDTELSSLDKDSNF